MIDAGSLEAAIRTAQERAFTIPGSAPYVGPGNAKEIILDGRFDAQALVDAVRALDARTTALAWVLAMVHVDDRDQLGAIASELLAALSSRTDAAEVERAGEVLQNMDE